MDSRQQLRTRPIRPALIALPAALGLAGLLCASANDASASQPPEATGQPASRERVERLSRRATERIGVLRSESDELASRERTLLGDIRRLELDRQIKTEELDAINLEVAETVGRLDEAADRFAELEDEAATQRPLVEARLVELYKLGRTSYVRLLFSSDNLIELGRAYRLIGSLASGDQQRFDGHRQTLADLEASRATLEHRRTEGAALQEAARDARRAVDQAIDAQQALVAEIGARRDLTARLTEELAAAREQLDATLSRLASDDAVATAPLALPIGPFRGQLEPPVPGEVMVPFGAEQTTAFGTSIAHGGIEFAATPGDSVYAVHEGEVDFAGPFEGLGTLVIVDHGNQTFSLYGYLGSLAVHTGVRVDHRTLLGTSGFSPTGNEVMYFELRIDGRPIDPVEWLEE